MILIDFGWCTPAARNSYLTQVFWKRQFNQSQFWKTCIIRPLPQWNNAGKGSNCGPPKMCQVALQIHTYPHRLCIFSLSRGLQHLGQTQHSILTPGLPWLFTSRCASPPLSLKRQLEDWPSLKLGKGYSKAHCVWLFLIVFASFVESWKGIDSSWFRPELSRDWLYRIPNRKVVTWGNLGEYGILWGNLLLILAFPDIFSRYSLSTCMRWLHKCCRNPHI